MCPGGDGGAERWRWGVRTKRPPLASIPAWTAAFRRLPARQREVIVLRLLLDLDTATTAQTLRMPGVADNFQLQVMLVRVSPQCTGS